MPIFALPVGIILIWMQRKPNAKGSRIALTVFLVSGCLIWFAILGSSGNSSSSSVQIQQSSQEISQEADTPQDNATIAAISAKWQGSTKAETTIVKNNNLIVMAALDDGSTKWLSDSNYTIDAEQELVAAPGSTVTVSLDNNPGIAYPLVVHCTSEPEVPQEDKNVLRQAQTYSDKMYMSYQKIYDQLTSDYDGQFSAEVARYAVDHVDADWNVNALAKANDVAGHF